MRNLITLGIVGAIIGGGALAAEPAKAPPAFAKKPKVEAKGAGFAVSFAADRPCDAAVAVLDRLAERMPFGVRAISIDNGSEFRAEFEAACEARGIRLFVLPPSSPKLHGAVERANRTHTEEFYEVTTAEPDLEAFQIELRAWEIVYNTIRPHQALGYLTPAEYLASVGVDV